MPLVINSLGGTQHTHIHTPAHMHTDMTKQKQF